MSNFNNLVPRKNTLSLKWDFKYQDKDILPMWVADMDFKAPKAIIKAIEKRLNHGILGYSRPSKEINKALVNYYKKKHNWKIKEEWIVWGTGIIPAMNIVCKMIGKDKDEVISPSPIYYYFFQVPKDMGKELLLLPLIEKNNRWTLDFKTLEKLISPKTKIFLLCNPQNPGGVVFTKEELKKLGDICIKNNIYICSDEVHCDLIIDKKSKHIPIASLSKELSNQTITLGAPTKTYNIPGLSISYAIIPNKDLRESFIKTKGSLIQNPNLIGLEALIPAYTKCENWHKKLIKYLRNNLKIIKKFIEQNPNIRLLKHEASYLAWIDISKLKLKNPPKYFEENGLGLSEGEVFGDKNFLRLNFACPKETLKKGLKKMQIAINKIKKD